MRTAVLLLLVAALLPSPARADVIDLGGGDARRSRRIAAFAVRVEAGTEFAPYGNLGAAFSYFTPTGLGGFEVELGAGGTFKDAAFSFDRGVQLGLAVRQLFGEGGDFFVFELSLAGNTAKQLGADARANRLTQSSTWTSLGIGFEHRAGLISLGLVGGLSFITAFDFVPHPMLHGGIGLAF